jgi:MYXO-CTERM domain-containing protein
MSLLAVVSSAAALLIALPAQAQPGELQAERPETWDMSVQELQAIGLGQYRGDPIPVPVNALRDRPVDEPPQFATQGVIFVNFDGGQMTSGFDNSKQNVTQIDNLAGSFAAYGEGSKRDAVMQAVRQDWSAYNVTVVEARPADGDYTMCMVGPTNPFGGGVLGIAPLDCNDSQTHNNVTYAFHSVNDSFSASTTATTIGQEVAHSYGLEHVNEPGDIMNPFNAGGDPSFRDECISVVADGGIVCGSQHSAECGSSGQQNSHAELITLFGTSVPDNAAPVVSLTAPTDGDEFPSGSNFEISVTATDDTAVEEVILYSNGAALETDGDAPYGWSVANVPEGEYEFYVEAVDQAGNSAMSNVITVFVGVDPPSNDTGDSGSGSGSGGSDSGGSGDSAGGSGGSGDGGSSDGGDGTAVGDDDGLPPGYGLDSAEVDGCGCRTDVGDGAPKSALLLLLGLFAIRRRR